MRRRAHRLGYLCVSTALGGKIRELVLDPLYMRLYLHHYYLTMLYMGREKELLH